MERIEKFDDWQQEIIDHKGDVAACCGRQVGKSAAAGKRRSNQMLKYPGSISLITAPSQRQSSELFIKTMGWLELEHQKLIAAAGGYQNDPKLSMRRNMELRRYFEQKHGLYAEIPTNTTAKLKNGSICYALPAGKTGNYLRTYALDFIDFDEAAYVPEAVFNSLNPMLMISKKKRGLGWKSLYSTPAGKGGFFYDAFGSDDYKTFHMSSEDCERYPKDELIKEKKRLPRLEYAQEYLGQFVDEFQQYFPTSLIKKCMTFIRWNYEEHYKQGLSYYYGHDYAGPGKDDNASVVAEMDGDKLKIVEPETDDESNTVIINNNIEEKDSLFKFKRLFTDSGGFGCGPTDDLKRRLGRRVVGLDNAKKKIQVEGEEKKRGILKEDLYSNAKSMMEEGKIVDGKAIGLKIEIINSPKLLNSLRSMTFERSKDSGKFKIKGRNSHLAEAFVRACWCVKEKGLNIFIY